MEVGRVRTLWVAWWNILIICHIFVLLRHVFIFVMTLQIAERHQLRINSFFGWPSLDLSTSSTSTAIIVRNVSILKSFCPDAFYASIPLNSQCNWSLTWFWLNSLLVWRFVTVVIVTTPLRLCLLSKTSYFFWRTCRRRAGLRWMITKIIPEIRRIYIKYSGSLIWQFLYWSCPRRILILLILFIYFEISSGSTESKLLENFPT